ncbi:MAG: Leptospira repeat protein [Bacteroidetes bacterium]|nr:Leptospira repeat protein [Bacteroidota bacterium]
MNAFRILISALCMMFLLSDTAFAQKKEHTPKASKYPGYDYVGPFYNGRARVKKLNKWGYIDTTGNVVVPPKYNEVENFTDSIARVRLSGKHGSRWGLIDLNGTILIEPTFDGIGEFINGRAPVLLDGKQQYYINKQGVRVD